MAVEINVYGINATVNNYRWHSDNKHLERLLNIIIAGTGPSPSQGYADLAAAHMVIDRLQTGEITKADRPNWIDNPEEVIY